MPWYNGPARGQQVALVGGPYETREAAVDALFADSKFAADNWPWTWMDKWFAVEVAPASQHVTARDVIEHGHAGPISNVRLNT